MAVLKSLSESNASMSFGSVMRPSSGRAMYSQSGPHTEEFDDRDGVSFAPSRAQSVRIVARSPIRPAQTERYVDGRIHGLRLGLRKLDVHGF
eukprot:6955656-Prymnesium_polylepis.3